MPAAALARRPPNVAATVAALDPDWTPPAPARVEPVELPPPAPAPELSDAEILNAIREEIFAVDLAAGTVKARGRELKTFSNRTDRRRFVRLHLHGRRRGIAVARLVWMSATLTVIPEGWEVHHDDEDAGNDAWANLICLHALDHRKKHGQAAPTDNEVPF